MFDTLPSTVVSRAVPGINLASQNTPERKAFHYIENIYDPDKHPAADKEKYVVPGEGELVFDVDQGRIYFVAKVDIQAGYKTTLHPWGLQTEEEGLTEQDWIFGQRGGPINGEAILAVDYSVRPNIARVDATIMRPGAAYALLYLGNDTSPNGRVISAVFDQSAIKQTDQIPCELAEIIDRTNTNIMTTGQFSVVLNEQELTEGTRCTVIFKDQAGNFIPPAQPVMVQHTAYMKDHRIGKKSITEVELVSPWFTNTNDPDRLVIPINTPVTTLEWRAKVHYSDGSSIEQPVNGNKFALLGLNQHRPQYPGQESELVLTYSLSVDEEPYLALPGSPRHISRRYTVQADMVQGAYSPKIYTYPEWNIVDARYDLRHWLYDLDRKIHIDVTDKVTLNDQSPAFRPTSYGMEQALIFNLNLRDVSNIYQSMTFRQYTNITLYKDVNGPGKRWDVRFSFTKPVFEAPLVPVKNNGTKTTFNMKAACADISAWYDKWYWAIDPSFDTVTEEKAPKPNQFDLVTMDGRRYRFLADYWDLDFTIPIELAKGHTYVISWVQTLLNGDELQLGASAFIADPV